METQSAEGLLVFDPGIYSDLDKYIWINDSFKVHREAQRFFVCMLKEGIYIKGFATDRESMFDLKMYNKKIYDINTLDKEKSIVFYDTYLGRYDVELPKAVHNARLINPKLIQGNIVIWGSGITGRRVFKILTENGMKIECYVDSNKELENTVQCGLPVYSPQYLKKCSNHTIIIEAMETWDKLDVCIKGEYQKRFYFSFVEKDIRKAVYNGHYINEMFNLITWNTNFSYFVGKTVYIYGIGETESVMAEYLKLLDINFGGFLIDESDIGGNETQHGSGNVSYVEDVLYEKNYFVWVYEKRRVKKMEELGLVSHENYLYYHGANNTSAKRKNILDTNLGSNYLSDGKYPGIMIYGNDNKKDFKIAVLGGSTTDGNFYSFKSWPELMYEELNNSGVENITVYNGGVCGYASGQELLKLIRDVLPLNPDMIIVYDGLNDLSMGFSYPLTNGYIKKIFEFAQENIESDEDESLFMGEISICQGIEAKKDMFDAWLQNIRTMYAIAKERNIGFYSFCNPMLGDKEGKTEAEKNMLLSVHSPAIMNLMNGSFRKRISQMKELPSYIYDLSYIFDNEGDVYISQGHVCEKGNRIIAKEISGIILPELCRK